MEKGGVQSGGRCLARRQNNEDPLSGRWVWPDRRRRADAGQHGRHRHGGTAARSFGAGPTAHRRHRLGRRSPTRLAPGQRHRSHHPGPSRPCRRLSAQPRRLPAPKHHRTQVRTAQELEADRDPIRSACRHLSRRYRPRRNPHSMAWMCPLPRATVSADAARPVVPCLRRRKRCALLVP